MSGLELVFGFILFAGVFHMAKAMVGSKALDNLRKLAGKAAVAAAPAPRNGRLSSKPAPVAVEEEEEDEDEVEEDEDEGDDEEDEDEEEEEEVETPPTLGTIRGRKIHVCSAPVVEEQDEEEEEPLGDLLHALCTIVEVIRDNADDILERLKG